MLPRELLQKAKEGHWAVGHFNASDANQLKAIVAAAQNARAPIFIGASEGERNFFGLKQLVALAKIYREETQLPIFLNADHTKSYEECVRAIDVGFDMIHFDGSALSFEENVAITKKVVNYAKEKNPDISVEGELGYLRGKSEMQEYVEIKKEDFTRSEDAEKFTRETGTDRLAIVFGNFHGIASQQEERLDFEVLKEISQAVPEVFLVLHGGSGIKDEEVKEAIKNGIVKVHFNTELRVAYINGIKRAFSENAKETTPYKIFPAGMEAMQKVVEEKIKIFGSLFG
ncbi:MAG: Ketose-bisphosphate aldolase, class-II [Parcubacteria group bacterium GW2011_GWA2_39_18]|nr:MAG: Ketose-bisphosphate aldolase, class-II [Parcubacteria group bacterium GW2011_GWA2_39_18]